MPDVNQAACGYGCDDEIASGNCPVHGGGATPIQQEADEVLTAQEAFDLSEDEARERGFLPPRQKAEAGVGGEIAPHMVKMVLDKIRDAYAAGNGPENILAFEIRYLQELCDLAMQYPHPDGDNIVLGPEVFVNPTAGVICWKGENYYKRKVTDEDRKLIAQNAKASIERRDRERAQKLLREMALHHAVEIHKAGVNTSPEVTVTADSILSWLAKSE